MGQDDNTTERKLTPKKAAFLASYPVAGTITAASEAAKISRTSHYVWLQEDECYREAFERARAELTESLEREALRRARDGWAEPVFHEGKVCGYKPRFSDTLLIFMLKALNPQKYRDTLPKTVEPDRRGLPVIQVQWVKPDHNERPPEPLPVPSGSAGNRCGLRQSRSVWDTDSGASG